jgi:hypothetical protein
MRHRPPAATSSARSASGPPSRLRASALPAGGRWAWVISTESTYRCWTELIQPFWAQWSLGTWPFSPTGIVLILSQLFCTGISSPSSSLQQSNRQCCLAVLRCCYHPKYAPVALKNTILICWNSVLATVWCVCEEIYIGTVRGMWCSLYDVSLHPIDYGLYDHMHLIPSELSILGLDPVGPRKQFFPK